MADKSYIERLYERAGVEPPESTTPPRQIGKNYVEDLTERASGYQSEFDYGGVPLFNFRARLGALDTPQEREIFLTQELGEKGWLQDRFGNLAITPEGSERLGLPKIDKPLIIDEPKFTRYDFADIVSEGPALTGGVAGATIGGLLGGPLGAGLGAMGGAALFEAGQELAEPTVLDLPQTQTPKEQAAQAGFEGAQAILGEGAGKLLMGPTEQFVIGPRRKKFLARGPEWNQAVKEAEDVGVVLNQAQMLGGREAAPLMSHRISLLNRVLGDPWRDHNYAALQKEMERLRTFSGIKATAESAKETGELVRTSLTNARHNLRLWGQDRYGTIDRLIREHAGTDAAIPTGPLSSEAKRILGDIARTTEGEPIFPAGTDLIERFARLKPQLSYKQLNSLRSELRTAIGQPEMFPGMPKARLERLYKMTDALFDEAADAVGDPNLAHVIRRFNRIYRDKITDIDISFIRRLQKGQTVEGYIPPDRVAHAIFKKGDSFTIEKVMKHLPHSTKDAVRREAMEDVLRFANSIADDPINKVFTGRTFLKALDNWGESSLNAMFGKELTHDLYRFGKTMMMSDLSIGMGGNIVAAQIAASLMYNLGKITAFSVLRKLMLSRPGIKWLSRGWKLHPRAEDVNRLLAMIGTIVEDETGAPLPPWQEEKGAPVKPALSLAP